MENSLVNLILVALILRLLFLNVVSVPVFDEGFYINAARNIVSSGVDPNVEHPPFGKWIYAAFILLGDNSITWRAPSLIFGIISLCAFYFLTLEIFDKKIATYATALLVLEPMHILFSRIAMLDIIAFGFMLLGMLFAVRTRPLIAGIFLGLAIATKLPAAAALLATIIFVRKACLKITCSAIFIFLLIVGLSSPNWYYMILKALMVTSSNPQSSGPLQWIICQKPVWLAWSIDDTSFPKDLMLFQNQIFALVAVGNPALWLLGFLLLFRKSQTQRFSLIWFSCTFFPYLIIPRTHTFIYYMLPVLPAYALLAAEAFHSKKHIIFGIITCGTALLPLAIGFPMPKEYFNLLSFLIGSHP